MHRKIAIAALLTTLSGGCSYNYKLIAVVQDGSLLMDVDPASSRQPECVRRIEVSAESEGEAVWLENISSDDDCANRFPLRYGHHMRGKHQTDRPEVVAKSLRRGTVYAVTATTGAIGYGGGRFVIRADGTIENLPLGPSPAKTASGR